MNFIVMVLLQQMPDEEDAFWSLVFIMYERGWREIFSQFSNKIARML